MAAVGRDIPGEQIEQIVAAVLKHGRLHQSAWSTRDLMRQVQQRIGQLTDCHKRSLLHDYEDGTIDRRVFLKMLGLGVGGAALAATGPDSVTDTLSGERTPTGFVTAPESGDLASFVNGHQGTTIKVPAAQYRVDKALNVGPDTKLLFNGTTITVSERKNFKLFDVAGYVGGNAEIDQSNAYPWVHLKGEAQFGDKRGRLRFRNHLAGVNKKKENNSFFIFTGDHMRVYNVDQPGPPTNLNSDANLTWTKTSGTVEVEGCTFENFQDNGFYLKAHRGRFLIRNTFTRDLTVGMCRLGCDKGAVIENCCIVSTDQSNRSATAGKSRPREVGDHGPANHSGIAIQDKNRSGIGDIVVRGTRYVKNDMGHSDGDPAGIFIREMNGGNNPSFNLLIEDCQWTGHPDIGHAPSANVTKKGNNSGNPTACDPTKFTATSASAASKTVKQNGKINC